MKALEKEISAAITRATGSQFALEDTRSLGGGCIHDARCLTGTDGRRFFIKQNRVSLAVSFEAEATALRKIAESRTLRVPEPVAVCQSGDMAALVLEYLPIGQARGNSWRQMGEQLARLHRVKSSQFGWADDNWIGSTQQINSWKDDWVAFYAECRLQPQFEWAKKKGLRIQQSDVLIRQLHVFFENYSPSASLLHGDLWAGNAGFLEDGTPVVYDPASYYGDPETDLAMTELFGGFPTAFYEGYESILEIDSGYRLRRDLYQLYQILNHYNLFGGGYGSQAQSLTGRLVESVN